MFGLFSIKLTDRCFIPHTFLLWDIRTLLVIYSRVTCASTADYTYFTTLNLLYYSSRCLTAISYDLLEPWCSLVESYVGTLMGTLLGSFDGRRVLIFTQSSPRKHWKLQPLSP